MALLLSVLLVLGLRWVDPSTSSFMLQRQWQAWRADESGFELSHQWVDYPRISPNLVHSVIASEDQTYLQHHGFDLDAIREVLDLRAEGSSRRGASTITQQTAKNLFLWPGRSWVRKGMEAWLTVLMEAMLSKQRIIELYLNVAEFGDGIYGAQAAAIELFDSGADRLTAQQAALLAARLPSPKTYPIDPPSDYMLERAAWIRQQVRQLGPTQLTNALNESP